MEKEVEIKNNNGHLLGILGALVGGAIGTLPWILCYVYANMMYSILAIVIAIGAFKGYELMKGKMDRSVPIIISIISVIAITVATLVVIPLLLILKETGQTSIDLLKNLYAFDEFKTAIIQDYIYSLLFTILGISGIVSNIKKGIKNGDAKIELMTPLYSPSSEEIDKAKAIFEKRNAMDKEHTIDKDTIMSELKGNDNVFNYLRGRGIIAKKGKGFYYSVENELHPKRRVFKITFIAMGISFAVTFLIIAIAIIAST